MYIFSILSDKAAIAFQSGKVLKDLAVTFFCEILIDSVCDEVVAAKQLTARLEFQREKASLNKELCGGELATVQRCTMVLFIHIGEATTTVWPYIVDSIAYDMVPCSS